MDSLIRVNMKTQLSRLHAVNNTISSCRHVSPVGVSHSIRAESLLWFMQVSNIASCMHHYRYRRQYLENNTFMSFLFLYNKIEGAKYVLYNITGIFTYLYYSVLSMKSTDWSAPRMFRRVASSTNLAFHWHYKHVKIDVFIK